MPTGQTVVNNALITLGILDQGGTPSASDSSDGINELNNMWDSWAIDEGLIWQIVPVRFPLTAGVAQWSIGINPNGTPLAQIVAQAPQRVYKVAVMTATGGAPSASSVCDAGTGYVVNDTGIVLGGMGTQAIYTVNTVDGAGAVLTYTLSNSPTGYQIGNRFLTFATGAQAGVGTGFTINITALTTQGGQNRNELEIVDAGKYYSHNDLSAQAQLPDECFPDYNPDADGFARLFFWPVPSASGLTAEIQQGVNFQSWSLTGSYVIPPGYADAINYALAFRLLPRYGAAVAQETAQLVAGLAVKAEQRLRESNAKNRQIDPALMAAPMPAQPAAAK